MTGARWVVVVAAAGLLTGCGGSGAAPATTVLKVPDPPIPATAPDAGAAPTHLPGETPPGVVVVPASSHVTGLPYPAHCAAQAGGERPDPVCTPGAIRDDIDPQHLERNVCLPGWSATVRPPKAETGRLKTQAMTAYGVPAAARSTTELDHDVPESMGGASDVKNLWPERSDLPGQGFRNSKDKVEDDVHAWVCAGHRDRWAAAVAAFINNWQTAKQTLGVK